MPPSPNWPRAGRACAASAGLVALGPAVFLAADAIAGASGLPLAGWRGDLALGAGAVIATGGLASALAPRLARAAIVLGLAAALAACASSLAHSPALALVALVGATALGSVTWTHRGAVAPTLAGEDRRDDRGAWVRVPAMLALTSWVLVVAAEAATGIRAEIAAALAELVAVASVAGAAVSRGRGRARALWLTAALAAIVAAAAGAALGEVRLALGLLALVPAAAAAEIALSRGGALSSWWRLVTERPAPLVVVTFLGLSLAGTAVLALPACAAGDGGHSLVDSAFTAVSAVCVTGLIVLDTPVDFSPLGQAVILVLIQLGALGIMSLYTAALGMLGRRLSMRHEEAVAGLLAGADRGGLFPLLRQTLLCTLAAELTGAVLLALLFLGHGDEPAQAAWRGLFTAVSAFCNAGFALQSDSLIAYQQSPAVLHLVGLLVIAGGLSPAVIAALPELARKRRVPVQVKVVVATSAALLVAGFVGFAALEWTRSLGGLPPGDRLHGAWFLSVTTRTAGFNAVPMEEIGAATMPLMFLLMFIGGSPGGTAGGIKTTTACLLLLAVLAALRGRSEARAFGRRIPHANVYKAAAIATLSVAVIGVMIVILELTQPLGMREAVFETVSAFGTVGLSVGGTAELDGIGKAVVMVAMFAGRVGPLTLFLFLSERRFAHAWSLPEESIEVG